MEWTVALEIFGLIGGIATVMALLLAPMIWLGSKIDSVSNNLNDKIDGLSKEVREEVKDFHGRLVALETKKKGG